MAKEVIGYTPNKIVLIADSSGAINMAALLNVIKDIEKMFKDVTLIFPSGFLAIYPSFSVAPMACPSILMSYIHPALSPPVFLIMQSCYMPFDSLERTKYRELTFSKFIKWLLPWPLQNLFNLTDGNNNENNENYWWNQSSQSSMERIQNWPLLKHQYASPLFCDDFESLAKVELVIFPVESDPILDHSIALANKWKGKVSVNIVDDTIHAFLPLADAGVGQKYTTHRNKISSELKRLVGQWNSQ